ncbi:MAG: aminotransferase class I/II-fold pyridoxal phosphate-dependent enzyme [Candidatus Thorarchaeota archaeon]|nr:aminotransferase class I/II-fold pyridoxal phosphate-dependent enzyme [Candidatus Thorarchaeota archaeon]
MVFTRMPLEIWFDEYQFEVDYDIGESGMKFHSVKELGIDLNEVELRYGYHLGNPNLRKEIAKQYRGMTHENVAVTTGASEGNFAVIGHLVGTKDHLIVEHPTYPSLYQIPRSLERNLTLFKLTWDNEFRPDMDKLRKLVKPNTKLITLTHPNNPTGSVITESELKEAIEIAENVGAYLMVDETYRDMMFDSPPPLAATMSSNAISLTSMSKTWGLPGIRIGWVVADTPIIEAIRAVREQVTICNSSLGEAIALAVLKKKEPLLRGLRKSMLSNFKILKGWMDNQEWLEWIEPKSGVVGAPRLTRGGSTDALCTLLVTKYRTFTVPGSRMELDGHLRIGFGGEHEELVKGLDQLQLALKEIHQ